MVEEKVKPYHDYLEKLYAKFKKVTFLYLPRDENQFPDVLATLASMIEIPVGVTMRPLIIERRENRSYYYAITSVEEEEEFPWYLDI